MGPLFRQEDMSDNLPEIEQAPLSGFPALFTLDGMTGVFGPEMEFFCQTLDLGGRRAAHEDKVISEITVITDMQDRHRLGFEFICCIENELKKFFGFQ